MTILSYFDRLGNDLTPFVIAIRRFIDPAPRVTFADEAADPATRKLKRRWPGAVLMTDN